MDTLCLIYGFISEFQTIIVGAFGFSGVIWTQKSTARLSREQSDRLHDNRRSVVVNGIRAELKMFEGIFDETIKAEYPKNDYDQVLVPRFKRVITPSLIPDLGFLKSSQIDAVLTGIMTIDEAERKLILCAEVVSDEHFTFSKRNFILCLSICRGTRRQIREAINAIDQ